MPKSISTLGQIWCLTQFKAEASPNPIQTRAIEIAQLKFKAWNLPGTQ